MDPGEAVLRGPLCQGVDGSPLLSLRVTPSFDRFYFADVKHRNVDALRKRIPVGRLPNVDLRVGDCNAIVNDVLADLPTRTLALAFLDPEGFEVHFATLRSLANGPVDILYLFPSGIGIKRNLSQFVGSAGRRMDLFWGGPEWRQLPMSKLAAGKATTTDVMNAATWVGAFRQKVLQELGLRSDQSPPLITNDRNARMYHLLFFSKSDVGLRIWRNISRIGPTGQRVFGFRS
ncbi:MAG TPA: three-Cys-motif partner protein TcmP [Candidatus Binatia bacterium]|nr:three-Cys-motif partner protein TcmP [Candidatus Binatia bacterium]